VEADVEPAHAVEFVERGALDLDHRGHRLPDRMLSTPASTSARTALRTVRRLTPSCSAGARSDGSGSPTRSRASR
jgi:hypothetical protein